MDDFSDNLGLFISVLVLGISCFWLSLLFMFLLFCFPRNGVKVEEEVEKRITRIVSERLVQTSNSNPNRNSNIIRLELVQPQKRVRKKSRFSFSRMKIRRQTTFDRVEAGEEVPVEDNETRRETKKNTKRELERKMTAFEDMDVEEIVKQYKEREKKASTGSDHLPEPIRGHLGKYSTSEGDLDERTLEYI